MTVATENVQNYIDCLAYIYDSISTVIYQSTGLPVVIERSNTNRIVDPFASLFIESLQPKGFINLTEPTIVDGVEYQGEYARYHVPMTIRTFKKNALAYMGLIRSSLKGATYESFLRDRNIGLMSESNIDNTSTILSADFEERAAYRITLEVFISKVDPTEFTYIQTVILTQKVYDGDDIIENTFTVAYP